MRVILLESQWYAIEYCNTKLNMENFNGSKPTVTFIKTFENLFDILNSKNLLANTVYPR